MKLPFRQGLVGYQRNGLNQPQYLITSSTPGYVALNVSPTPTLVTLAHGQSDYLLIFERSYATAWGPITSGVTNYLYFDIDLLTGNTSFGITLLEPVVSSVEPAAPVFDQHWFDLNITTMRVWNGANWLNKVRAFAGRVPMGSIAAMTPADSEPVGPWKGALQVSGSAGYLMLDYLGQPIRSRNGEFVTSDTLVRFKTTSGTSGVLAVPPNGFVPVRAGMEIPRMSLVYFSAENTVSLASGNAALDPPRIPIGIIQEDLSVNEIGDVTLGGELTYDQWDWSAHIGKPLYCGSNGELVTTRPNGLMAYRVGFVKAKQTIVFQIDSETQPQIYQTAPNDLIVDGVSPLESTFSTNGSGERVWTVEITQATAIADGFMPKEQVIAIDDVTVRVTATETALLTKAPIVHGHTIANVTGLQTELDGKAPFVHNHIIANVTGLQTELDGKAPFVHLHAITDVTNLQAALDDKAPLVHTHIITDVIGLELALDAKAAFNHGHVISDVTGLQLALDGKEATVAPGLTTQYYRGDKVWRTLDKIAVGLDNVDNTTDLLKPISTATQGALNGKANTVHGHVIADVTGLQTALNGKSNVGHTHVAADVTDFSTAADARIAAVLVPGANITITPVLGTLVIASIPPAPTLTSLKSTTLTFAAAISDFLQFGTIFVRNGRDGDVGISGYLSASNPFTSAFQIFEVNTLTDPNDALAIANQIAPPSSGFFGNPIAGAGLPSGLLITTVAPLGIGASNTQVVTDVPGTFYTSGFYFPMKSGDELNVTNSSFTGYGLPWSLTVTVGPTGAPRETYTVSGTDEVSPATTVTFTVTRIS